MQTTYTTYFPLAVTNIPSYPLETQIEILTSCLKSLNKSDIKINTVNRQLYHIVDDIPEKCIVLITNIEVLGSTFYEIINFIHLIKYKESYVEIAKSNNLLHNPTSWATNNLSIQTEALRLDKNLISENANTQKELLKECIGYIRVSSKHQAVSGLSLANQELCIKKWSNANNIKLINIVSDKAKSGKRVDKRVKLVEILENIQKGQILVTYSLSRISRSVKESIDIYNLLKEKEICLVCINEAFDTITNDNYNFFLNLSIINEYQQAIIVENTKSSLAQLPQLGRHVGRPCYGFMLEGGRGSELVENPEEIETLKLIIKMSDDFKSAYEITKYLNDNNYKPPKNAKKWYATTISRIITREL